MITSKSTTSKTKVTVFIGHSAPTTPNPDEIVGFSYDLTVTYGNGKSYRYYRNTPVLGKTNNQLDLLAMVFAMQALKQPANILFVTDSKYILDTFAKLRDYVRAGWKTRTGAEVANKKGWQCLIDTAKKGGHHFSIEKAEGVDAFQVSNCHLEAKKAVNLQLIANAAIEAKASPVREAKVKPEPEAKAAPAPEAKVKPEPKAAQPAPDLPASPRDDIPREQLEQLLAATLGAEPSSPEGAEIPEIPADAEPEKPFSKEERFMLDLKKKARERFPE